MSSCSEYFRNNNKIILISLAAGFLVICPVDATSRNAEVNKCVDKEGLLYEEGESYTHVDGCNTCTCTEHGGVCTKKFFCLQRVSQVLQLQTRGEIRILAEIVTDKLVLISRLITMLYLRWKEISRRVGMLVTPGWNFVTDVGANPVELFVP